VKRFVGNDSGENGVAGAASVWAAATGDRDEAHVANSAEDKEGKSMVTILTGDCRQVLKSLPDCSVHCCVTSPPYW